jgi:transcription elongation factor GreA
VSPTAPLGSALLGARAGDWVSYEAPNGELRVRVLKVEPA